MMHDTGDTNGSNVVIDVRPYMPIVWDVMLSTRSSPGDAHPSNIELVGVICAILRLKELDLFGHFDMDAAEAAGSDDVKRAYAYICFLRVQVFQRALRDRIGDAEKNDLFARVHDFWYYRFLEGLGDATYVDPEDEIPRQDLAGHDGAGARRQPKMTDAASSGAKMARVLAGFRHVFFYDNVIKAVLGKGAPRSHKLSNVGLLASIRDILGVPDFDLFADLDLERIFEWDDHKALLAASYVCDLRAQVLHKASQHGIGSLEFNKELQTYYGLWLLRLRERANALRADVPEDRSQHD